MPEPTAVTQALSNGTTIVVAAGFAVQRFLEIFDGPISKSWPDPADKKFWSALIASAMGFLIAHFGQLSVLFATSGDDGQRVVGVVVTGLAIGAGTEGVNSLLKAAQYSKDAKRDAAKASTPAEAISPPADAGAAMAAAAGRGA